MTTQKKRKLSGVKKISMKRNINKKSKVNRSKKSRTNTKKKMKGGARRVRSAQTTYLPGISNQLDATPLHKDPIFQNSDNEVIQAICKKMENPDVGLSYLELNRDQLTYFEKYAIGDGFVATFYKNLKDNLDNRLHSATGIELLKIYKKYKELPKKKRSILATQLEFIKTVEKTQKNKQNLTKSHMGKFFRAFNKTILPNFKMFTYFAPLGSGMIVLKKKLYYEIRINRDGSIHLQHLDEFLKTLRHYRYASIDPTNQLGLQIIKFKNIAFSLLIGK